MKQIFQRHPDYCFESFLALAMWYNRILSIPEYQKICSDIAREEVTIYPNVLHFLNNLPRGVQPVLVTSGAAEIWRHVLDIHNLSAQTPMIAGNHIGLEQYVVDVEAKGCVVSWIKEKHRSATVWAFGDSGTLPFRATRHVL